MSRKGVAFAIGVAIFLLCGIAGGSNRADIPSLIYLRPLASISIGVLVMLGADPRSMQAMKPIWALLISLATYTALQLVPLSPTIWTSLQGHATFKAVAPLMGIAQPWRPISIAPDATWNSLASFLIPIAILLGITAAGGEWRARILPWIIGVGCASALLGLIQLAGGSHSPFYLYPGITDPLPVGLLANRNHQALLLASTLPMLAAWVWTTDAQGKPGLHRYAFASMAALILLPTILATGSRSGLVLAAIGSATAIALLPWHRIRDRNRKLVLAAVALAVAVAALMTVYSGRALVFDRIAAEGDLSTEMRVASAPTVFVAIRTYLPLGTGMGSFDPAFRMLEPDKLLTPTYRNHAHNDLLELIMTGGVPAAIILLGFLAWLGLAGCRIWRLPHDVCRASALAATTSVILIFLGSLTDYPLRVPLVQGWFTLCCAVIATAPTLSISTGRTHDALTG